MLKNQFQLSAKSSWLVIQTNCIIFTDGTNYYARNGNTGKIELSGTDASAVIQSIIDNFLTGGGTILLKGRISLGTTGIILKYDGLYLEGLGAGHDNQATKLIYNGTESAIKVEKTSGALYGFGIKNLYIATAPDATGIELHNAHWGKIENVYVYYGAIGIKINGAWETEIDYCIVRGQNLKGILLDGSSGAGANHVTIQNCYLDGAPVSIEISDFLNNLIGITIRRNNFGMGNNTVGIKVNYKARNLVIENNYFEEPLGVSGCRLIQILGNSDKIAEDIKIENNSFITANIAIGLDYVKGVIIERNWIYGYGTSPKFVTMSGNSRKVYIIRNMRVETIATDSLTNEAIVRDDIQ
jgi:hypothetical protein